MDDKAMPASSIVAEKVAADNAEQVQKAAEVSEDSAARKAKADETRAIEEARELDAKLKRQAEADAAAKRDALIKAETAAREAENDALLQDPPKNEEKQAEEPHPAAAQLEGAGATVGTVIDIKGAFHDQLPVSVVVCDKQNRLWRHESDADGERLVMIGHVR